MAQTQEYVFFAYEPSMAAAVIFIILFGASTIWHIKQVAMTRTWFFIAFIVGSLFETVGYIGRAMAASETPHYSKNPYIIQSILLLLGPTFFAASIYMILGRLIRLLDAECYSPIRTRWLTKVFVLGDVLSFFAQGGGGGILATAKTLDDQQKGNNVILGGLGIQIIFFSFFIGVTVVFHRRFLREPTTASYAITTPWQPLLYVLYATSLLILVRSLYRVVEYAEGSNGNLQSHEFWLYIFDALLMFLVAAAFNWMHPSRVLQETKELPLYSHRMEGVSSNDKMQSRIVGENSR